MCVSKDNGVLVIFSVAKKIAFSKSWIRYLIHYFG